MNIIQAAKALKLGGEVISGDRRAVLTQELDGVLGFFVDDDNRLLLVDDLLAGDWKLHSEHVGLSFEEAERWLEIGLPIRRAMWQPRCQVEQRENGERKLVGDLYSAPFCPPGKGLNYQDWEVVNAD